eukprot:1159869-Pelagomonas_calceolata.AAC.2
MAHMQHALPHLPCQGTLRAVPTEPSALLPDAHCRTPDPLNSRVLVSQGRAAQGQRSQGLHRLAAEKALKRESGMYVHRHF